MTKLSVEDALSKNLNKFEPKQLLEVISGLKPIVDANSQQAQSVLAANADLTYAIVQSMLLMGLVNEEVINDVVAPSASATTATPAVAASAGGASASAAPAAPVDKFAGMDAKQVEMIKQVLSLSEDQIKVLPSAQQIQVRQLRAQYT